MKSNLNSKQYFLVVSRWLSCGALAASLTWSVNVGATPIVAGGALNTASFDTVQNVVRTQGGNGLNPGDLVYGLLNVTNITANGGAVWDANNVQGSGIDSLSGYYLAQVMSVTPLPFPYSMLVSFGAASYDPNGKMSAADLASGTIVKLFADTGTPFQATGNIANDITKATDGQFWISYGLNGGYWDAVAMVDGLVFGSEGFNVISDGAGLGLGLIANPQRPDKAPVQLYVSTNAELRQGGGWQYVGSNVATMRPAASVPEPSVTMLSLVGLMGMFWSRRKN